MKTVLITRPKAQAESLIRALQNFGLCTEVFPMIDIAPRTDWQTPDVSRYNGFIFTSQNAVQVFFERLQSSSKILFPNIFVVGEKTRLMLQSFGYDAAVVPEKFSAENLAALFRSLAIKDQTFLFVCGNLSRQTVPETIHALGGRCEKLVVYDTETPKDPDLTRLYELFKKKSIDVVAFTSPSTARHFYELGLYEKASAGVVFAAIGETTAFEMRELGMRVDVVPSVSTAELLAVAIAERLQKMG